MGYNHLIGKTIATKTLYIWDFLLGNVHIFLQALIAIFIGFYFNAQETLYTTGQLITYYLIGVGIINVFQRNIPVKELEKEISMGNLSVHLSKPYDFVMYIMVKNAASKLYNAAILFVILTILFSVFISVPAFDIWTIIRAIIIVPFTIWYMYLNTSIWMYLTIPFEKLKSVANMWGMIAFFVGGGLISTDYLPRILQFIPQEFYFHAPLNFILFGEYTNWYMCAIYVVVFIFLHIALKKWVTRRLEINGG